MAFTASAQADRFSAPISRWVLIHSVGGIFLNKMASANRGDQLGLPSLLLSWQELTWVSVGVLTLSPSPAVFSMDNEPLFFAECWLSNNLAGGLLAAIYNMPRSPTFAGSEFTAVWKRPLQKWTFTTAFNMVTNRFVFFQGKFELKGWWAPFQRRSTDQYWSELERKALSTLHRAQSQLNWDVLCLSPWPAQLWTLVLQTCLLPCYFKYKTWYILIVITLVFWNINLYFNMKQQMPIITRKLE